ncbi:hypothetical protein Q4534_18780 [Cyclobacterium sp. 1_MG-2023]|uniref:hypothetical protein n=1 Tax=Cyclobacterium sp. 1_MG-2023 TaxID=3062681 RepID=UPI0026E193BF|nr:hypothetical protein [Cyclobacterium sp. 1_MG-2023]MDO6439477.1 hypothetical protein [Cyclobacterium sp. 1_MG-2023]
MADNIDDLDKLFKNALSNHSTSPAPEVWDKLSASLDKKNKGFLFTPWRWAAGVAVVLVSFWLFHHSFDVEVQKTSLAVQDTKISEKDPYSISPTTEIAGKEKVKSQTKNITQEPISKSRGLTSKEKLDKPLIRQTWTSKKRVREQLPQVLAQIEPLNKDELTTTIREQLAFNPSLNRNETTEKSNKDYKVKIISNGYAIQPEKEQLVAELENKIGGFFTKVDEGFGDLRDAKNNLFASLTTKREKRKTN